jgi:hypothetical protein
VRKTWIAFAATIGIVALGNIGASAAPATPLAAPAQLSGVQQADWYCGPRCQYWRHRRWVARHHWRYQHHQPNYGYNGYYHGYPNYR